MTHSDIRPLGLMPKTTYSWTGTQQDRSGLNSTMKQGQPDRAPGNVARKSSGRIPPCRLKNFTKFVGSLNPSSVAIASTVRLVCASNRFASKIRRCSINALGEELHAIMQARRRDFAEHPIASA